MIILNIKDVIIITRPYLHNYLPSQYLQSNGKTESVIETIESLMKKATDNSNYVTVPLLNARNTYRGYNSTSPAKMFDS